MQVKTYWAGRCNGDIKALERLDVQVEKELGHGATIHSVTDTTYGDSATSNPSESFIIARVIVFSKTHQSVKEINEEYFDPFAG